MMNLPLFIWQISSPNPNIGFWDILDFAIVAYLVYTLYKLLKGTVALNIFIGVMLLYILWWTVGVMNMHILSSILDQFVSVGVIVLVIIFQPEIRRFLLMVGSTTTITRFQKLEEFIKGGLKFESKSPTWIKALRTTVVNLQEKNLSASIVVAESLNHESLINSGVKLNALLSIELVESLALATSPVSEGAMVVYDGRMVSAGCSLPVSGKQKMRYSLRERMALGISEQSNAFVIVVTPSHPLQYALAGELVETKDADELFGAVDKHLTTTFAL